MGGHFFQWGAIARRPRTIFQMLLALRISQDMHYYKDGAVRLKRQVVLILELIRQGGCLEGGTWRIIPVSKQLYSNRHL